MAKSVPKETLRTTTKCRHNFSCLETGKCGDREMCEVSSVDGQNVLFLKTQSAANCSYRLPFGNGQLCTCPTHYHLKSNPDEDA